MVHAPKVNIFFTPFPVRKKYRDVFHYYDIDIKPIIINNNKLSYYQLINKHYPYILLFVEKVFPDK